MKSHRSYHNLVITLSISILTLCLTPATLAQMYTITDLGPGQGNGINQSGQVTGGSFFYSGGAMTNLGTLGGSITDGMGINASGQITGWAYLPADTAFHAFLYSGGTINDLGTLGGNYSVGNSINDSGQITGWADVADGSGHAFLYDRGAMKDLGTLGGSDSGGTGINASGQVAGYSWTTGNRAMRAFLYSGGVMTDLGTLGGNFSQGSGINASGQVTGSSLTTPDPGTGAASIHAFLYSGGVMKDLGSLGGFSWGFSINSSGQVVGLSYPAGNDVAAAFLYTSATGMVDLNTLIPANSGWYLFEANGINDAGQITGLAGTPHGDHAVLLSPASTADLAIRVGGAKAVRFGGNLHYVVVVQNKGPQAAKNVIVTDTLPAGARVVNLPRVCRLGNSNSLTCKLGIMATGSGKTIHFMLEDVTFANVGSRFSNTARVSGDVRDPNTANNTATRTSVIK